MEVLADKVCMKFESKKIYDLAENSEVRFYQWIYLGAGRLLHSFFLFKRQKGEILAGAVTFFAILSFCPLILLAIGLTGTFIEDPLAAKQFVMNTFSSTIPNLAPWIVESIGKIVENNVKSGGPSIMNSLLLFYSLMGLVSTVVFGINYISQSKVRGGIIVEDFKSALLGGSVGVFLLCLIFISEKDFLLSLTSGPKSSGYFILSTLFKFNFLSIVTSLAFFTYFYKYATAREITQRDAFKGAVTFVGCFLFGKSFYWVYFTMFKAELEMTYGNFFTIFTAVLWIYYLTCSFFYGATTAYIKGAEVFDDSSLFEKPQNQVDISLAPPLPVQSDKTPSKKAL